MSKPKSNLREADVKRVIRAAEAAGLDYARVEVDPTTSRITLIMPDGEEHKLLRTADLISAVEKIIERKRRRT